MLCLCDPRLLAAGRYVDILLLLYVCAGDEKLEQRILF